jgi:hypothetical protein
MNCTNTEQSKKLLELGLKNSRKDNVWTEEELRNLLPNFIITDDNLKHCLHIKYKNGKHVIRYGVWGEVEDSSLLNALYITIIYLIEDGFVVPTNPTSN